MEEIRHRELIEQLESIESYLHLRWSPFLLSLGVALWYGLAPGPAILVAWAGHWVLFSIEFMLSKLIAARRRIKE